MSGAENKAVFLSYASQDAEAAKRICDALRAAGVEVWFDADGGLEHGDEWDAKIRRQIKECVLFIPIISANTQAREEGYFRLEWDLAAERARTIASGVAFILPVVIDGTKEADALVPERFRAVQWTKLPGGVAQPEMLQRFLKLWSHRAGVMKHEAAVGGVQARAAPDRPHERGQNVPGPDRRGSRGRGTLIGGSVLLAVLAAAGWAGLRWSRQQAAERRLHEVTLPEIAKRLAAQDIAGAFTLAEEARRTASADPALQELWDKASVVSTIETTPAGAQVSVRVYTGANSPWQKLGITPLKEIRLPRVMLRYRLDLPGRAPCEIAQPASRAVRETLAPVDAVPAGMVLVAGRNTDTNSTGLDVVRLQDFFIDRFEVTNRQFKEFVDRGGYLNAAWWEQPFVKDGRTLTRNEALAQFVDATGQPGPASWRNGTYPAGMDDFPVTGVSWFEAAAYAAFAGKRLPTIYHWRQAATLDSSESVVPLSNFAGRGPARVGAYQGMSAAGAFDMAGNAKEWCWNTARPDTRYILGGAWREPEYMFTQADAMSPFDRSDANGFRCMQPAGKPSAPELEADVPPHTRDYAQARAVDDATFAIIRGLFTYDKTPLEARLEGTDDSDARWRKEKVSYRAAYGGERITAYVFLPKNAAPPYQTIVFFPGSGSMGQKSSENLRDMNVVAMLVASGRALILPVYQGTYERGGGESHPVVGSPGYRDWVIMLGKDVQRTVDYLESRPDVQPDKLAYMGHSWGGANGAIFPAIERRLKVNVLLIGGFYEKAVQPEVDQINFAPRITVPTLMLSGRYDFRFPLETSQRPMFKSLGAPPEHKKHVLYDTGHTVKPEQIAGEVYTWLDRYLGVVK